MNMAKNFCHSCSLIVLYNYLINNDSPTKLFSDLYLEKFLNTLAKPFSSV